jgi:hypothetical protein
MESLDQEAAAGEGEEMEVSSITMRVLNDVLPPAMSPLTPRSQQKGMQGQGGW